MFFTLLLLSITHSPTAVRTGFQTNSGAGDVFNGFLNHLEKNSPLPVRGLPKPEDIAHTVVFLASEKANYITGITVPVDCGATLQ